MAFATLHLQHLRSNIQNHHQSAAAVLLGIVVGRVVWNMAMNQPFARTTCLPNNIVALPRSDIDRIGFIARAFPERLPVKCHHRERTAMYMHRVHEVIVAADEAQFDRFTHFHFHGFRGGVGFAVDGEIVRQRA